MDEERIKLVTDFPWSGSAFLLHQPSLVVLLNKFRKKNKKATGELHLPEKIFFETVYCAEINTPSTICGCKVWGYSLCTLFVAHQTVN